MPFIRTPRCSQQVLFYSILHNDYLTLGLKTKLDSDRIAGYIRISCSITRVQLRIQQLEVREGKQIRTHEVDACTFEETSVQQLFRYIIGYVQLLQTQEADVFHPPRTSLNIIRVGVTANIHARIEHILIGRIVGTPAVVDVGKDIVTAFVIPERLDTNAVQIAVGLSGSLKQGADRK